MAFEDPVDFEPPSRPSGDSGVIWDLIWGSKRLNAFAWDAADIDSEESEARLRVATRWWNRAGDVSAKRNIVKIAENKKVDAVILFAATMAWYGPDLEGGAIELDRVAKIGNALKQRSPGETPNEWFTRMFTKGGPAPRLPGQYVSQAGYVEPKDDKATTSLFDRVSENWQEVMPIVRKKARRKRGIGGDVFTVSFNNLFAALWSAGVKPQDIKKDPTVVDRMAARFATLGDQTINQWFRSEFGAPAGGRKFPGALLKGVKDGTDIPLTESESEADRDTVRDFHDPPQFTLNGVDIRASDMRRFHTRYDPIYQFYGQKRPSDKEIFQILKKGTSDYELAIQLTGKPEFFRSPAWKQSRLTYTGVWNDMMGATKRKPPRQLIRKAIINKWSSGEFAEALRGRKDYLESNEFTSNVSTFQNIYAEIFGGPITPSVKNTLQEAALARWSPDQFASWLRAQPEYGTSVEFAGKVRNLNVALSNAFGTAERRVKVPPPQSPTAFDLPDSERIEGSPGLTVNTTPAGSEFE